MKPVLTYGVARATPGPADDTARIAEELAVRGVAILEGALSPTEVADYSERLDAVYRRQCDEVGGEAVLHDINDADVARCPLAYDDAFLGLAQHRAMVDAAKAMLGKTVVLMMQNGIINRPGGGHFQTHWHRDLNYQHWISTAPIAINALFCLEDFNEETGATAYLPATHKSEPFPSDDFVRRYEVTVTAPRGSIIFMDAMLYHRAGSNRSNRIRRAVNHVIGVPILAQAVDIPAMLGRDAPSDPWLAGYLGYRWNPAPSVREWRLRKMPARRD